MRNGQGNKNGETSASNWMGISSIRYMSHLFHVMMMFVDDVWCFFIIIIIIKNIINIIIIYPDIIL